MSRELVIVFLYDCDLCKSEEDDPQEAIIYFYPTWVSGEQRHALCSQLMGVAQFCTTAFSAPAVISLQSGKFAICRSGRFALCVGTDRNIPESILRNRLNLLFQLLRLFHCSIDSLDVTLSDDDDGLADKFSGLLQTYLPIALDGANPFENIPLFKIPKTRLSVLDKTRSTLENLMTQNGVLGGTVLYQNKVIFTHLSQNLTKLLILAHPHKVKLPAYDVATSFFLPNGVQLLTVFVDAKEIAHLRSQAKSFWSSSLDVTLKASSRNGTNVQNFQSDITGPSALFFLNGSGEQSVENLVENGRYTEPTVPDLVLDAVRARQLARLGNAGNSSTPVSRSPNRTPSKTTDDLLSTTNIPIRLFSLGLPKVSAKWTDGKKTPFRHLKRSYFNTICDPKYPLFKPDGLPASYTFYSDHNGPDVQNNSIHEPLFMLTVTAENCLIRILFIKGLDCKKALKKSEEILSGRSADKAERQLTLSLSKYSDRPPPKDKGQLTPLMAKLALSIAPEETFIDEPAPGSCKPKTTLESSLAAEFRSKPEEEKSSNVVQMALFVYGEDSASMAVLMEKSVARDSYLIHHLWEKSSNYLKHLEAELDCSSESGVPEVSSAGEYSYAVVDPEWGPAERGGFHHTCQLEMLTVLHDSLQSSPQIIDLLVREEDSVTYGYRCGKSKVFYQQNCSSSSGVPTPADLMGVIPLKATSVLSRDHNILKSSC